MILVNMVSDINCTPPAVNDFPKDIFSRTQLEHGAIIIHILATIYIFVAVTVICDDYFVPTVEKICHICKIPPDIAGATLMATATSSPELFINIIGTFITEGDIGLGTIVGSSVFNILAVTACCGLTLGLNGSSLKVDWWHLTRDCVIYAISVCLLIIFLNNHKVEWYEAVILIVLYLIYLIILIFDKPIQKFTKDKLCSKLTDDSEEKPKSSLDNVNVVHENNFNDVPIDVIASNQNSDVAIDDNNDHENELSLWKWPGEVSKIKQIIWLINWPLNCVFFLTIPHCERVKSNKWIPVGFIMCILWIGVLSYILSWMITVIGDTWRIPDSVTGLSFLAIGAGIPEAASSIIVVRKGKGTMGISNSLGSNTFDILLCLGVPWLLKSTLKSTDKVVHINSAGLQYNTVTLLITLFAFYLALVINKFKLNKIIGLYCLVIYLLFLILATLIELNIFFPVNLPTCNR